MLDKNIRILNFDGSVVRQKGLVSAYETEVVDLVDLGPAARFWLSPKTRADIASRIRGSSRNAVTFLGSGDFHHIGGILASGFDKPMSIIDFDFHPDWSILPMPLGCYSWVVEAMKNASIQKFILVGLSSGDMSFSMQAGDYRLLKDDRLEIYPYMHKPSNIFLRSIPPNISIESRKYSMFTRIYWNELRSKNITEFFLHVLKRLPTKNVYVTIDKDCLNADDAVTNWETGNLPLEDLLSMLKLIKENLDVVGMDITGDYSPVRVNGFLKKVVSYIDHPKDMPAQNLSEPSVTAINESTNLKILETMLS